MKITRVWHGLIHKEQFEPYKNYVEKTGIAEYKKTKGNISAKVLIRFEGDYCHFYTVTEWDSYESIQNFAGENYEIAKYYDEDKKYLIEFEEKVMHFETYDY